MMNAFDFPPGFADEANNLAIDFDGVIHDANLGFHDGTCYGEPIPGSIEAIKELALKYRIVIFTAKAKPNRPLINGLTGTQLVQEWLNKYGILDCIAEVTSEKPRAIAYIDDNGFRFVQWVQTMQFIDTL